MSTRTAKWAPVPPEKESRRAVVSVGVACGCVEGVVRGSTAGQKKKTMGVSESIENSSAGPAIFLGVIVGAIFIGIPLSIKAVRWARRE